jgi:hypothetical protein
MRTVFNEIKYRRKVTTFCTGCRKKLVRTVVESQTVNPWNKNEDGSVKSPQEVSASVLAKLKVSAELLETSGAICQACDEPKEQP